jgi:PAS domain S-box-containing protein
VCSSDLSEIRFKTISDHLPGSLIYQIDSGENGLERKFTFISSTVMELHGVTPEAVLDDAMLIYNQIHEDDRSTLAELESSAVMTMSTFKAEARVIMPDGEIRWRLFSSSPRRMPNNRIVWDGIEVDITDRKRIEEKLHETEMIFSSFLEYSPVYVFFKDKDIRAVRLSRNFEQMIGMPLEKILGKTMNELFPSDLAKSMIRNDQDILNQGKLIKVVEELNGKTYETTKFPIYKHGIPDMLAGFTLDITDRVQAEKEKEELQIQLLQAQKMESIGRLAGGVAHDFNNMIMAILGNAELAMTKLDPSLPVNNNLKEIINSAKRSAELTHQLLAFARKQVVQPSTLDLNDLITGMINMIRRLIGENIRLNWQPAAHIWPVRVDPTQIHQILVNLAVNARDAINGSGELTITTSNAVLGEKDRSFHGEIIPGDYVMIEVSDSGCGMDKVTLSHLFEPFYTTKEQGKGTGLGLATVYGIIKQNNGLITVSSEVGKGSLFSVYLPRTVVEDDEDVTVEDQEIQMPEGGTETILLLEDEESILSICLSILTRLGYTVLSASTPIEAISIAETFQDPIHLVITDVVMPQMNGRVLVERISAMRPGIKSLFMSGYTADIIAHHGVIEEGFEFIQKPFVMKDLAAKIRHVLDESSS